MFRQLTAILRVYTFLVSHSSIVCASGGCGLWFARCGQLLWNATPWHSTAVGHTADSTGVAYVERLTLGRWQLAAETCRGNLMSIVKYYNTLEHLLVILHRMIVCVCVCVCVKYSCNNF
jgi:hypothetical protein